MLRIAVCDDMTDFLQVAKRYLEEWSDSPARLVVELFSDGESLIERHQAAPFDMIFLDVIMPMQSGIENRCGDSPVRPVGEDYSADLLTGVCGGVLRSTRKPLPAKAFDPGAVVSLHLQAV